MWVVSTSDGASLTDVLHVQHTADSASFNERYYYVEGSGLQYIEDDHLFIVCNAITDTGDTSNTWSDHYEGKLRVMIIDE